MFERVLTPQESHGGEGVLGYLALVPIYVPVLIGGLTPWCVLLPATLKGLLSRGALARDRQVILLSWIMPTFVLMSLVSTKLPHYILPIFPGVAIATAAVLCRARREAVEGRKQRWVHTGNWFYAIPMGGLVGGVLAAPWLLDGGVLGIALAVLLAAAVIVVMVYVIQWHKRGRVGALARLSLWTTPAVLLAAMALVLPWVEAGLKPSPRLASLVRPLLVTPETDVAMGGYEEPSLVFYTGLPADRVVEPIGSVERVTEWLARPGSGVAVLTRELLDDVEASHDPAAIELVGRIETINYSAAGRRDDVLVVRRRAVE